MCALLDEATEDARAEAEACRTWFEITGPLLHNASFSSVALRQALDNVLASALRFAPKDKVSLIALQCQQLVRIVVADSGICQIHFNFE